MAVCKLKGTLSRFPLFVFALLLFSFSGWGQQPPQPAPVPRQITGQLKLGGEAAPQGVPVRARIVFSDETRTKNAEDVVRTLTDAMGRFTFAHLEKLGKNQGQNMFAVSAIHPGFEGAVQVVDLTQATQAQAVLDLRRIPDASSSLTPSRPAPESLPGQKSSTNAEAQQAVKQGQNLLFRQHDLAASVEQFKKAVKLDPWYGQGYMLLGLAQMESQHWGEAQYAFEEAAKVEPGNNQAFLGIGSALNQQGHYAQAEKALEHSLELKPDSAEGHYELARSLAASGKWDAAEPHAQRAIELNSDYAGPHALLGNIYLQQEDAASALAQFKDYLRLAPQGSLAPSVRETVTQLEAALAQAEKKGR